MHSQFLEATKAMMDALDLGEGMSSHELECFHFNFQQFTAKMIDEAKSKETEMKHPMTRHDWGRSEQRVAF